MKEQIKASLKDIVIFRSENEGVKQWQYFEELFESFIVQKYILKPYDNLKSLSRCDHLRETEILNFKPHLFKQTEKSPRQKNLYNSDEYI